MSVEDPRLSSISEENLTENFSSEIQEEIAASSTPSPIEHEIQVAQAGDGRTPTTNRVPTDPNAPPAAPAAPAAEVTPDANNIVHLATSVSIDDIRVDGANLILVQADGTEIVIVNGATKIPTMLIGEVEVPQQVLFAALEDSGINVAAGPDGSFSASGRPDSSGAEFDDSIQGSQNDPIQLASLLGDTEFGDGGGLDDRTAADDQPDAFDMGSPFIFSESVLADDVIGNETITGTLGFDGGDDFGIVSSVNYQSASDMAEGTGSGVAAPLTSGGQAVTVSTSADGLTVTGTITVGETTVTVFTLTVTNPTTGAFTYTQSQPLDHPDLGEIGADDALRLNFTFTVTDKDGDSDTGSFSIEIGDDGPVQREAGGASLNEDDVSAYPATDGSEAARKTGDISLGISWGADADTRNGEGDTFGRSVGFANSAGAIASAITTTDASTFGLSVTGGTLTSGGNALNYVLTSDVSGGQTLTAYIQGTETKVFQIVLDPTASKGSYTVEIFNELDHAEGSNSAALSFKFVGTDADGDHAAVGTATVTIADDQLVVGTPQSGDVDEDGWTQLASGAGNLGPLLGGGDSFLVDTVTTRSLNISWGADNANDNVNGGYVGAQVAGDRSVVFGTNSVPADLTSNGFKIVYEVGANGTELIAYRQQNGSYYDADGNVVDAAAKASAAVFKVSLSDAGSGSYTFTLLDNIDQSRGNEENNTNLNFQFVARDADGDQVTKSFSVSIDDDTPVLGSSRFSGIDEDDIGTAAGATTNSLDISWGADRGNAVANGGHSNADGDRYVVFDGNSAPNGLTSNGHAIRYETSLNGTLLTAYRFENGHYVGANGENLGADKAGAAVFTVGLSDQGSGSYTFTLIDNLDHSGFQGGKIRLGFDFTAVDGDGDDADGSFDVWIDDDTPSLTSVASSSVDEDGLLGGNAGESYPGATGTNADLAGASTTTGAVSLGVNWGADADIKSEYLGDNRDYDDDPIGREINFVRAGGQVIEISTGKISDNNVSSYLGSAFANLRSDGVSLDYRIDYLRDASGNWNGGYVLTAYKDGTDPTATANQVFKVTLDPTAANGSYKFDLLGNLDHSGANAEDNLDLTFNFRATDSDGDPTGRGSFTVTIDDDAPIASVVTVAGNALLGDETAGADAGTDDMAGALPSAFSSLGTALGWSQQANMVSTAGNSYGADGAGSQSLALTKADGGVFNGESSGIQTLNGSDVKLYTEGNLVVGKVGATVVFALSIDGNGTVSMAQYQPIKHGDAANANETASVNGVYVTTTISDREGDTARATTSTALDIKVRDDAPTVSPTQTGVTVDEDGLSSGNGAGPAYTDDAASNSKTASANLSYNFGTDGLAGEATNVVFQTSNLASLGLKSLGTSLSYAWDNSTNTLTATAGNAGPVVFTLKVTDVATGAYTFSLERSLDHSTTSGANREDDINIDFNFTIRDGDGDPASGTVRVTIDDDAPYIGSPEAETVSEVNLPYTLGDEANADSDSSTVQRGNLDIHWGADNRDANFGPDVSVRFGANSAPSGLTSNGETIRYDVDGTTLTAYTGSGFGARIIFTVSLDDNGSGQYTFKLYDNIDHTNADAASKTLSFNFIAEDSDNDEASGSFNVTIADGGPSVGAVENETVNENALPNNIFDAIFDDTDGSTVQRGDLNINWGADDNNSGSFNRSVTFNAALNGADSGLTHDGTAIMYTLSPDGTVLTAKAGATTVFTVSLSDSGDGSYTFILNDNIDHLGANGSSAALNFGFTAKDSDGDTAPGSFAVTIVDDTPEADTPSRRFLEEDSGSPAVSNVSLGIDWKSDDNNSGSANRSVAFANATPAANITNAAGQPITLTSSGQTLSYALLAGVLVAYVNGDPAIAANRVFEVSLNDNGSGSYTFTLHQPLDHGAPISNDDAYLDLRFLYTATDSDGDGDNASFTVRVDAAGNVTNNGNDISYDDLNSGVFVNLGDNSVTVNGQTVAGDTATDLAAVGDKVLGIDRMNGIVNVTGGDGNDVLVGSSQANTIRGGAGNDTIIGNGGDDTLEGDVGNDLFIYKVGDGNDRINGGTETSNASPNYDVLRVEGDAQARTFNIGLASGGTPINAGFGNAADIAVSYDGSNSATIRADEIEGIDIVAGSGAITVNVGSLAGTAVQPNTIRVTGSNSATGDVVDASGITAANAVSVVFDGNEGNDTFIGGAGNDVARGGTGNDTFTGGLGADTIEGGAGNDIINLGADQIVNGLATTMDSIDGGADHDKIILTTGTQGFLLDGNATTITRIEEIVGTDGNDTITLRDDYLSDQANGGVTINGGKGNDAITGGKGNDVITGGEGTDTLKGGAGADTLIGGADNDVFWGGKHSDNLFGNGTTNVGDDLYAKAGEQDKAMFGSDPSNYEVTWNAAFQTWEVLAKSGAVEFGGTTGPGLNVDRLFGIELIQFANGVVLDLTDPIRVFNGSNLIGTYDTIQQANDASTTLAGYRIELVGTVTNELATITKNDLTVVGGVEDAGIVLTLNGAQNITLQGAAPINVIGDGQANAILGNDGANVIKGVMGSDTLNGGAGNDTFVLGADVTGSGTRNIQLGDGSLLAVNIAGLAGTADKVIGGAGNDTIILERDGKSGFVADYSTAPDYLSGVEKIVGTDGNDVILLAAGSTADGGPITLEGGNGNDTLGGSNSADIINGGDGNDLISGLDGNDILEGGAGSDEIWGGAGADQINGGTGSDNITGGLGNDTIDGGAGGDTFNYTVGDGIDTIDGGSSSDLLLTNGRATAESAIVSLTATGFTVDVDGDGVVDVTAANVETAIIYQDDGADQITVRGQDNAEAIMIEGDSSLLHVHGSGMPWISGISTSELTIEGKGGNDVIDASAANIPNAQNPQPPVSLILDGGVGNDTITGSVGADTIYGGADNDTLIGGKGDDLLDGGTNSAVGFNRPSNPASGDAAAIIASAFGGDTADYSSLTTGVLANLGDAATWPAAIPAHSAIDSNGANDAVGTDTLVDIENLTGGIGDDILAGDGNDNILKGGAGSDTLLGGAGDDLLIGGDDNVGDGLLAGAGNDVLILGNGGGTAKGEGGDDLIYGGSSGDWLYGEDDGNPNPADAGADTIFAGGGNDHIEGGGGADKLYGEDGDDTLIGGLGNDLLDGGTGNDTFVYKVGDGSDIIDGGTETGSTFPNYDVLKIAGDAESRTFTIGKSILADPQNVTPTDDRPDLLVTYSGTGGTTVRADEIEGIEITLHAGGGTVNVGDLSGTAIEPSTIVINGGTGNDTIDLTGLLGTKVVVNDVDGIGGDTDTVKLAGKWADYDITESNGTFTISLGNHVVATTTNVEQFTFIGESGDGMVTADQLLNDAPLAVADSNSVVEAGGAANGIGGTPSATGNVLGNDTDADSGNFDTKHVTAVKLFGDSVTTAVPGTNGDVTVAGNYGTLTIHRDGSYDYALDNTKAETQGLAQGASATDVFTYTMADAHGVPSTADLTINITGTNDAPVIDPISAFTIDEDTAWSVSSAVIEEFITNHVSDVDVSATPLTYQVFVNGAPASDVFTATSIPAEISYTPAANFNGQLNAQFVVSDGITTTTRDFNINVSPVNDAPVVTNDVYVTDEDTALSGLKLFANDSDVEGSPLTGNGITVGSQLGGSISLEQNGTLYYKPLANESGYAVLQYSVSDGNLTSTGTVTIDVRPIADTATISGSGLGNEDATAALSLNIAVSDTDGSEKVTRVELSGFPAGATFNQGALEGGVWVISNAAGVNTSGLTMTPPANYAGNFALSVAATVLDSATLSDHLVHTDTKVSTGSIGVSITAASATVTVTGSGSDVDMSNYDKIVYNNASLDPAGNTAVVVNNFDTENDRIAISLNGSSISGGFTSVSSNSNIGSGVRIVSLTVSVSQDQFGDDGHNKNIEQKIVNATEDYADQGNYIFVVYSSTNASASAAIYNVNISSNNNVSGGNMVVEHVLTLVGVGYGSLTSENFVGAADPIILDLDHNGFAFTSVDDGVKFDINADGKLDQVAWTKTDGILAFDVDGNGKIDNGSEIFTPSFAGGAHAGGVAALSTLDVNHDGKIDASDTGFDKLLVWQDANGNGVSDEGELKGLHDYDITGISLDADSAEGYIDGQSLFAEGSFTYADGSTGSFVEVGFDTLFSEAPDYVLVGTDGDDILAAMPGLTQMTGGAGADTFVLDPSALHELDMADIITDYKSNEGDAVDVSKLLDTLLGHQATGEEAAANVRTTIAGNDTTVSVQVATDSWKDVAVLQNHTEAVRILFDDDKHSANISHV
ncbi:Hypothetical protein NGAL_HAMBI2610_16400 [Neorhizobium galegae bv. orientalis]|nr:Hypothetical protein NGAL_HAMBI2610_16400 [Neorhizobium galegae bv. orientalis]